MTSISPEDVSGHSGSYKEENGISDPLFPKRIKGIAKNTHEHLPENFSTKRHEKLNEPLHFNDSPRAAGIASMMRLPIAKTAEGLDACFVGVPIDHGTTNRPGSRFGPRQIRAESVVIKKYNIQTGADPFSSIQVADIGDINAHPFDLVKTCDDIRKYVRPIIKDGCRPLIMGGDHTITYPVLQAMKEKYGPLGIVHVDAHSDCADGAHGIKIFHGSSFRRAIEENLLICNKVYQIGIRGTVGSLEEFHYQRNQGFKLVHARDCWYKSLAPLMREVRTTIGDAPTYISFDIDALDPSFAPGTGVPEIGGLTTIQALEIIQGCRGLNIVGCDLVEVSPPYDTTGTTALTAANLLFELLCILPGVKYHW